ncbi:MAG TPA: alpha/beta fold hydrolase [Acidobacteriaceae bacterium]
MATRLVRTPADLRGPTGRLEGLYAPGSIAASHAAVLCHPHPLFGGTMHNKVVYHAAKVFEELGLPVLRFNFRGAGASEGAHDRGEGEREDLQAALAWLQRETGLPVVVTGFSFGAWVALRTCCGDMSRDEPGGRPVPAHVTGIVALGLPIQAGDRSYTYDFLARCGLPLLAISGAEDAFASMPALEAAIAPATLIQIPRADHFFQRAQAPSGLAEMQTAMRAWLQQHLPQGAGLVEAGKH